MKFNLLSPPLFLSGAHAFGGIGMGMGLGGGQLPGINLGLGGGQLPGINLGLGGQHAGINLGLGGGQIPGINLGFGGGLIPGFNFGIGGGQLPGIGIGFGGSPWLPGQGNGSPGTSPGTNSTFTQHYAIVCPRLDRLQLEINPGYKVVLYCGVYGKYSEKQLNAKSLEQCAQLCENEDGCVGSTWLSDKKKCLLSGNIPQGFREQTIYMQRVMIEIEGGSDPFAEDCERDLQQCNQQNTAAQQHSEEKLRKCEEQCSNAHHQATEQLRQCQKQNSDAQHHSAEQLRQCSHDQQSLTDELNICSRNQQLLNGQLGQCRNQNIEAERDCNERVKRCEDQCSDDKQNLSLQLIQCDKDKFDGSNQLRQCNSEKLTTSTELSHCNSDKLATSTQLIQCNEDKDSLLSQIESLKEAHQKEIEALRNQNNEDPMKAADSFMECESGESKTLTISGQKYTLWCGRIHAGVTMTSQHKENIDMSDCLDHCNNVQGCKSVRYERNKKACYPVASNWPANVPPPSTNWPQYVHALQST